jgi:hypothetical protein
LCTYRCPCARCIREGVLRGAAMVSFATAYLNRKRIQARERARRSTGSLVGEVH